MDEMHAFVELMGHAQLAGKVEQVKFAGADMILVTVPATASKPEFTRYVSPSAIYSITPCDAPTAAAVAERLGIAPIPAQFLQPVQLPLPLPSRIHAPIEDEDDYYDGYDDDNDDYDEYSDEYDPDWEYPQTFDMIEQETTGVYVGPGSENAGPVEEPPRTDEDTLNLKAITAEPVAETGEEVLPDDQIPF